MRDFARLPAAERAVFIQEAAARLGLPAGSVEKDFWVCWTLRTLFSLPSWGESLTFKGGTSLSKGWKLIRRLSEDIDVVLDRDRLGFSGENSPEVAPSNKQRKKRLEALRSACQDAVHSQLLPDLQEAVKAGLGTIGAGAVGLADISEDVDQQTVIFTYPGAFADALLYVRPVVKIEFGARSDTEPSETPRIMPYVAEEIPAAMADSGFVVKVVAARRTFLEKVCLLHEETFRPSGKPRGRRMARHYYDVWSLITNGVGKQALDDAGLFERVAEHRPIFFGQNWVDYGTLKRGSMRLIPPVEQLPDWRKDYDAMREEMFWGEVPTFNAVLDAAEAFERELNRL